MFKKIISFVIIMVVVLSVSVAPVYAVNDAPSAWAKEGVEAAIKLGFVPERLQSDYQKPITREEFASLFVTALFAMQEVLYPGTVFDDEEPVYDMDWAVTRKQVLSAVTLTDYNFKDTSSEDVKMAYILGLIDGTSATTFSPNDLVTREQAAKMLASYGCSDNTRTVMDDLIQVYKSRYTDLDKASSWSKEFVNLAYYRGIFLGTSGTHDPYAEDKITLDPKGNFTREQAITIAYRIYYNNSKGDPCVTVHHIFLRGLVPFVADAKGINWELSKTAITAVDRRQSLIDAHNANRSFLALNYRCYTAKIDNIKSHEALLAAIPRMTSYIGGDLDKDAVKLVASGEHVTYDMGHALYEANAHNFMFQYRLKNNGYFCGEYYGGEKCLDPILIKVKVAE